MNKRKLEEIFFKILMMTSAFIVVGSLVFIVTTIFIKGFPALNLDMITKTPEGGYYIGKEGGVLNAILGSIILGLGSTFLEILIALPLAFYLNLYLDKKSRFAFIIRFFLDILWGIPSIVYGAFGFTLMLFFGLKASLLAGIIALSFVVLPIMVRSMDEVLKMVPVELEEASLSLGATKLETGIKVIIKQAMPGLLTAVLIAFGRGISDAAAVLFTTGFTDNLPSSLFKPVASLPLAIFFQLGTPFEEVQARGYASALILTVIILLISIVSRILTKRFSRHIIK
ncbi:MAG: phosphate ABC transporter permease PstA [bacterium]